VLHLDNSLNVHLGITTGRGEGALRKRGVESGDEGTAELEVSTESIKKCGCGLKKMTSSLASTSSYWGESTMGISEKEEGRP